MREFFKSLQEDARASITPAAWGFSASEYIGVLKQYPSTLCSRVLKTKSAAEMEREVERAEGNHLQRVLGPLGLTCIGVGRMLGAGIFLTPGIIAVSYTGPAVCVTYLVAAVSAFLSCFVFAEFAVDLPVAGSAYNYIATSLGEGPAWVATACLLFEYVLSNAAVIRGFAPYFAVLVGKSSDFFYVVTSSGLVLDWWAFAITLSITFMLSMGARESTRFNTIMTIAHLVLMIFIIGAGLAKADTANFHPFLPESIPSGAEPWRAIFSSAAIAFFSFNGFDAVTTGAEEVINPRRNMPLGIVGSLSIVTVIYVLMVVVLCLMVPRSAISTAATFAAAFEYVGLPWVKYIVCVGALMGMLTGIMIGIYAPSRVLAGAAKEGMLPPMFAWVGPRQTPWVATWIIGSASAVLALLEDFEALTNMVSAATLLAFWFVAVALLWRRNCVHGFTPRGHCIKAGLHVLAMVVMSLLFTLTWALPQFNQMGDARGAWFPARYICMGIMGGLCFLIPLSMQIFVPQQYTPAGYRVPLYPWVPCASVLVNTFLMGQVDVRAYTQLGYFMIVVVAAYLLYGVFAAQAKDNRTAADEAVEGSSGKPTPSSASHPAKAITTGRQTAHEISSGPSMGIPVHGALSNPAFGASFQSIALSVTGQPSLISAATTPMYVAEVDAGAVHARSAGAIQAVTHGSLEHLALAAHLIEGADTTTTAGVQNTMSMSDTGLKDATGQAVAVLVAPVSQGASAPLGLPSQPRTASPSLSPAPSTASSGGSSVRVSPSSCVIEPDAIRASLM